MPCTIIGNDDIDDESVFEEMMFENVLFCKSWGSKVKLERCFTRLSKIEGETRSDFVKVLLILVKNHFKVSFYINASKASKIVKIDFALKFNICSTLP